MDAKLKKKISQIAAERNRSFSNLVETVLMKYVESKKKKNARKPFAETDNP
jgi:predicted transcriptional regulator